MTLKNLNAVLNDNKWFFYYASQLQRDKLAEANARGRSLKTLATIIWTCTEGFRCRDIYKVLEAAKEAEDAEMEAEMEEAVAEAVQEEMEAENDGEENAEM